MQCWFKAFNHAQAGRPAASEPMQKRRFRGAVSADSAMVTEL